MSFPSRNSSLNTSFPQSISASDTNHNAPSIISSRMTDIVSEDGDEYHPEGAAASAARSKTLALPGGQSEFTRPQSPQRDNWNRSPPSRRGAFIPGSSGGWRPGNAFGGPGVTMSNTSRPQNATSRSSKTHVPSLASHAFFRPMSSQRLQAQRSGRPLGQTGAPTTAHSDVASTSNRQSLGSNQTGQIGYHDVDIPPPSRGTEFTEQDLRDRASINPAQSVNESTRPLHRHISLTRPTHNESSNNHKHISEGNQPVEKSTGSFRSSFLPQTSGHSGGSPPRDHAQGHERLSSDAPSPKSEHANVLPEVKARVGSNYQYHLGNTIFCLGGRFQNTRDRPINIATGILVVLPAILFLVYSGPYFWHNVSPAIPIFFAYIFYICISSFVHASVTDPGILPRNLHPLPSESTDDPLALGPSLTDWILIRSARSTTAAMEVPTKYCKTCNIWRPPRAHHCRICNNCVETQDHHCVWLNNCVGRRNYRYFFTFVSFGTILGIFLTFGSLGHCLRYQSTESISFRQSIDVWRVPFAMFLYGLLITPYPSSLTAYHLFLMGRGETTREYLNSNKFLVKDRHRPFDQGNVIKNWIVVLMRPRPPTYLRFKDRYTEGDQRFGSRRAKRQVHAVAEQQAGGVEMGNVGGTTSSIHGSHTQGTQR